MATKTITLELDAYEKLKAAKLNARESFSSVIRRTPLEKKSFTALDLLEFMKRRHSEKNFLSDEVLNHLEEARKHPRRSPSRWEGS